MKIILTSLFASLCFSGFALAGDCGKCKKGGEEHEEAVIAGDCGKCKKGGKEGEHEHDEEEKEEAVVA